jgi:hypothetical protein
MKINTKIAIVFMIVGIASLALSLILGGIIFTGGLLLLLVFGRKQEDFITGKAPLILLGYRFKFERSYINYI